MPDIEVVDLQELTDFVVCCSILILLIVNQSIMWRSAWLEREQHLL